MTKRYGLYDEDMTLVRIFTDKDEAEKFKTSGSVILHLPSIDKPKVSLYELAIKKVGFALL